MSYPYGIYPENYPENYDWLPQEKQEAIIKALNYAYDKIEQFKKDRAAIDTEQHDAGIKLMVADDRINHAQIQLQGMITMLDAMEIKVERGWYGRRDTYFLCTALIAEMEWDWLQSLREDG